MTAPQTGPDAKAPDDDKKVRPPAAPTAPAAPAPLAVVSFARVNPVTRREHRGVGVVVSVDADGLEVAPVQHGHHLRLALDEVTVVTADDGEV